MDMGSMSISELFTLLENSDIVLDANQKTKLINNYTKLKSKRPPRIDDRIQIIRALIARGVPKRTIVHKLNIQNYHVEGALGKRKSIEDDIDWTVDTLQLSSKYQEMKWTAEEFKALKELPPVESSKGIVFDYAYLRHFEKELVE